MQRGRERAPGRAAAGGSRERRTKPRIASGGCVPQTRTSPEEMPNASSTFHSARQRRAVDGTGRRDARPTRSSTPTRAPFGSSAHSRASPSSRYDEALAMPWSRGSRPVIDRRPDRRALGRPHGRERRDGAPRRASRASPGTRARRRPRRRRREPVDRRRRTRGARRPLARSRIGAGSAATGAGPQRQRHGDGGTGTRGSRAPRRSGRSCRGNSATSRPIASRTQRRRRHDDRGDGQGAHSLDRAARDGRRAGCASRGPPPPRARRTSSDAKKGRPLDHGPERPGPPAQRRREQRPASQSASVPPSAQGRNRRQQQRRQLRRAASPRGSAAGRARTGSTPRSRRRAAALASVRRATHEA